MLYGLEGWGSQWGEESGVHDVTSYLGGHLGLSRRTCGDGGGGNFSIDPRAQRGDFSAKVISKIPVPFAQFSIMDGALIDKRILLDIKIIFNELYYNLSRVMD